VKIAVQEVVNIIGRLTVERD